jgi:argininosuccinate lyase
MENTGRIRKPLTPSGHRILLRQNFDQNTLDELLQISFVDQAHLVMLRECGIIPRDRAAQLLARINRLQQEHFAPLRQKPTVRGLFLAYEDYLIETEGTQVGGVLQTARSRNDLNATVLKMKLRRPYLRLLEQCLRLHAILLRRAIRFSDVVMPVYTHGQAAMPITYGHYLAGVATALQRDLDGVLAASKDIQSCPLGAGGVAGTSFPIQTQRTAELLGFDSGPLNSLDAVASRDLMLRLLAAGAIYGLTLSRVATDLLQWTTAEFNFLCLPDELVGSSSAMPQKRNPFLLEHVQGRSAALTGAFVHAIGSMHAMPFTNCIAVGTEAAKPLWGALQNLTETTALLRLVVAGAEPNREAMLERSIKGFTVAVAFADRLVSQADLDFRTAHRMIGSAVLETLENENERFERVASRSATNRGASVSFDDLDPAAVARSLKFGGGPGSSSLNRCLEYLKEQWRLQYRQKQLQKAQWEQAQASLNHCVQELVGPAAPVQSEV